MKVSLRIPIDTAAMQTDPKAIGKGYTVVDTGDSRDLSQWNIRLCSYQMSLNFMPYVAKPIVAA